MQKITIKEHLNKTNMKTQEEIEQLAFLKYPRVINDNPLCRNPNNPMEDDNTYERKIWIGAYTQCQQVGNNNLKNK